MKKIFLSLLLIVLFSVLPIYSQVHSSVNPIYLGLILVDEPTTDGMAKVCQQYDFIESVVEDDTGFYQ